MSKNLYFNTDNISYVEFNHAPMGEVYINGDLVFADGEVVASATLGRRVQANNLLFSGLAHVAYGNTPPIAAPTVSFTSIPEIVFIEGYADTEDLNLYILDSENYYPAASMPWDTGTHPSGFDVHITPNTFAPIKTVDISGSLPTGVTWNKAAGTLSYSGSSIPSNETNEVNLSDGDNLSRAFNIKVLKITEIYDYHTDGVVLHDTITNAYADNPTNEVVILVKQGTYELAAIENPSNYFKGFQDVDNYYLIGEPGIDGHPPILSGDRVTGFVDPWDGAAFGDQLTFISQRVRHVHIKNIRFRHARFKESAGDNREYFCLNKTIIDTMGNGSGDNIKFIKPNISSNDSYVFISNFETFWTGSYETKHAVYSHHYNGPAWAISTDNFTCNTHVANYKAWETHSPGQVKGGHAFKDLGLNTELRHFWISRFRNPAVDTAAPKGYKLISLHTHRKITLTNGVTWDAEEVNGTDTDASLLLQNRGPSAEHFSDPPYFDLDVAGSTSPDVDPELFPCWENWSGLNVLGDTVATTKNAVYHGSNVGPYNYSTDGAVNNETANATPPGTVPFWDEVGDVSSLTNTHEKLKHKFISDVVFNNVLTASTHENSAIKFAWDAPENPDSRFGAQDNFARLPVPPNWKPLTHLFLANNTYNNFSSRANQQPSLYNTSRDGSGPLAITYPYTPTPIDGTTILTNFGGDIIDGVGAPITLPEGFKI